MNTIENSEQSITFLEIIRKNTGMVNDLLRSRERNRINNKTIKMLGPISSKSKVTCKIPTYSVDYTPYVRKCVPKLDHSVSEVSFNMGQLHLKPNFNNYGKEYSSFYLHGLWGLVEIDNDAKVISFIFSNDKFEWAKDRFTKDKYDGVSRKLIIGYTLRLELLCNVSDLSHVTNLFNQTTFNTVEIRSCYVQSLFSCGILNNISKLTVFGNIEDIDFIILMTLSTTLNSFTIKNYNKHTNVQSVADSLISIAGLNVKVTIDHHFETTSVEQDKLGNLIATYSELHPCVPNDDSYHLELLGNLVGKVTSINYVNNNKHSLTFMNNDLNFEDESINKDLINSLKSMTFIDNNNFEIIINFVDR